MEIKTTDLTDEEIQMDSLRSSISNNFGDYIVQAPIGRGAGSFVVKVESRKTKKEYAVKVVDKKSEQYKSLSKRLLNEIKIHSMLDHPNIVKLINSFEDSDNHYLMLEYCQAGDLFHYLKGNQKLSEDEARNITKQLAEGLKYLHDNKIIHRDLKLGNILLTGDHTVKICDLGLATKLQDFEQERNTLCGTPNYLSPEIINREPYGIKIDCWSFGCILYALVTGKPPFESQSIQETLQRVKQPKNLDLPAYFSEELKDLLNNIITWSKKSMSSQYFIKTEPSELDYDIIQNTSTNVILQNTNQNISQNIIIDDIYNNNNQVSTNILDTTKSSNIMHTANKMERSNLSPICISNIKPYKFQTQNGFIEITKQKELVVEACLGKLIFIISKDGQKIRIQKFIENSKSEKCYDLQNLPKKYYDLYNYAKKVNKILLSKTVKVKLTDSEGKFSVMEDGSFEGKFNNGIKVSVSPDNNSLMKIKTPTGLKFEINFQQMDNCENLNPDLLKIVQSSEKYYKSIINQQVFKTNSINKLR